MTMTCKEWIVDKICEACVEHDESETTAFALTMEILEMHVGPNDETIMDVLSTYNGVKR
jgi:hypothetical protein